MHAHLEFDKVAFHWASGKGFADVSFALQRGDFAVLTGPSGEGKSTLLRLLVRFEPLQSGRILYNGETLESIPPARLRRRIALVQQTPIMGGLRVRDALLLPFTMTSNADLPRPDDAKLKERLVAMRLEDVKLDAEAETLSLGQKQRVALIRSLLLQPDTLLLDEPTSALDEESRHTVEAEVENANAAGATVLMITHTDYRPRRPVREFHLLGGALRETPASTETA